MAAEARLVFMAGGRRTTGSLMLRSGRVRCLRAQGMPAGSAAALARRHGSQGERRSVRRRPWERRRTRFRCGAYNPGAGGDLLRAVLSQTRGTRDCRSTEGVAVGWKRRTSPSPSCDCLSRWRRRWSSQTGRLGSSDSSPRSGPPIGRAWSVRIPACLSAPLPGKCLLAPTTLAVTALTSSTSGLCWIEAGTGVRQDESTIRRAKERGSASVYYRSRSLPWVVSSEPGRSSSRT